MQRVMRFDPTPQRDAVSGHHNYDSPFATRRGPDGEAAVGPRRVANGES